jgi:hypothetical protein
MQTQLITGHTGKYIPVISIDDLSCRNGFLREILHQYKSVIKKI